MVHLTKEIFYKNLPPNRICNFFHPTSDTCCEGFFKLIQNAVIGSNKFFFPIYILQVLINRKKINSEYAKGLIRAYLRTILYATSFICTFFSFTCLYGKLFTTINYYSVGVGAGFLSGLSIYLESNENRNLNTLYFFNLAIEGIIKKLQFENVISRTRFSDTFCFMICSSILMYLFKTQKSKPYNNLWFYPIRKSKFEDNKCTHEEECGKHLYNGFLMYFGVGYALEIVKNLISKFGIALKKPNIIFKILFNKNNVRFGLVTGGYVLLFRIITCYLFYIEKEEKLYHSILGGFFAGMTYYIRPNLQFGISAFSTIMQLLLQRFQKYIPISNKLTGLFFAVLNSFLLHQRIMFPDIVPQYIKHMSTTCTNGLDNQIFGIIYAILENRFFET